MSEHQEEEKRLIMSEHQDEKNKKNKKFCSFCRCSES
jgi:hypothetical protein